MACSGKSFPPSLSDFVNLNTVDVLHCINLSCGGWPCTLEDTKKHPWPLPSRCQQHFSPTPQFQPKMSSDIAKCPSRESEWIPSSLRVYVYDLRISCRLDEALFILILIFSQIQPVDVSSNLLLMCPTILYFLY